VGSAHLQGDMQEMETYYGNSSYSANADQKDGSNAGDDQPLPSDVLPDSMVEQTGEYEHKSKLVIVKTTKASGR
jgi:hypothetical protein